MGNTIKSYLCTDLMFDDYNLDLESSIFSNTQILNFNQKSNFTINGNDAEASG